jgi:hypothetical protein
MSTLDLSEYIRVINRTGKRIKARYDGKDYIFEDGDATDVHHLAAAHIFGFGCDDKTNAFHRLGWLQPGIEMEDALERLKDIEFIDVPNPATNIKSARKVRTSRTGSATPLASPGADDGEGASALSPTDADEVDDEEAGTL